MVQYPSRERSNFQYVVVEVDEGISLLCRDELLAVLTAENVLARRYFYPGCHHMPPYRDRALRAPLPVTERLASRTLALPTGTAVTDDDISVVCDLVRRALSEAPAVKAAARVSLGTSGGSASH